MKASAPPDAPPGRGQGPLSPAAWRALRTRPSLALAGALLLVVASAGVALGMHPAPAFLLGFDTGACVFLAGQVHQFRGATPARMRSQARLQDAGRWGILWSGVALSAVALVALGTELQSDKNGGALAIVIAAGSVVLSWLFLHTLFALHYAHGYYGDYGRQHEGLEFPRTPEPDYWDFAYFAFVIGMTFQVSDVQVSSRYLRRMVLLHGVIAFFFNVIIIALSVNVVANRA